MLSEKIMPSDDIHVIRATGKGVTTIDLLPATISTLCHHLYISYNSIETMENVVQFKFLTNLSIESNIISRIESLYPLKMLTNLRILRMQGNPVCNLPLFAEHVKKLVPWLEKLNNVSLHKEESNQNKVDYIETERSLLQYLYFVTYVNSVLGVMKENPEIKEKEACEQVKHPSDEDFADVIRVEAKGLSPENYTAFLREYLIKEHKKTQELAHYVNLTNKRQVEIHRKRLVRISRAGWSDFVNDVHDLSNAALAIIGIGDGAASIASRSTTLSAISRQSDRKSVLSSLSKGRRRTNLTPTKQVDPVSGSDKDRKISEDEIDLIPKELRGRELDSDDPRYSPLEKRAKKSDSSGFTFEKTSHTDESARAGRRIRKCAIMHNEDDVMYDYNSDTLSKAKGSPIVINDQDYYSYSPLKSDSSRNTTPKKKTRKSLSTKKSSCKLSPSKKSKKSVNSANDGLSDESSDQTAASESVSTSVSGSATSTPKKKAKKSLSSKKSKKSSSSKSSKKSPSTINKGYKVDENGNIKERIDTLLSGSASASDSETSKSTPRKKVGKIVSPKKSRKSPSSKSGKKTRSTADRDIKVDEYGNIVDVSDSSVSESATSTPNKRVGNLVSPRKSKESLSSKTGKKSTSAADKGIKVDEYGNIVDATGGLVSESAVSTPKRKTGKSSSSKKSSSSRSSKKSSPVKSCQLNNFGNVGDFGKAFGSNVSTGRGSLESNRDVFLDASAGLIGTSPTKSPLYGVSEVGKGKNILGVPLASDVTPKKTKKAVKSSSAKKGKKSASLKKSGKSTPTVGSEATKSERGTESESGKKKSSVKKARRTSSTKKAKKSSSSSKKSKSVSRGSEGTISSSGKGKVSGTQDENTEELFLGSPLNGKGGVALKVHGASNQTNGVPSSTPGSPSLLRSNHSLSSFIKEEALANKLNQGVRSGGNSLLDEYAMISSNPAVMMNSSEMERHQLDEFSGKSDDLALSRINPSSQRIKAHGSLQALSIDANIDDIGSFSQISEHDSLYDLPFERNNTEDVPPVGKNRVTISAHIDNPSRYTGVGTSGRTPPKSILKGQNQKHISFEDFMFERTGLLPLPKLAAKFFKIWKYKFNVVLRHVHFINTKPSMNSSDLQLKDLGSSIRGNSNTDTRTFFRELNHVPLHAYKREDIIQIISTRHDIQRQIEMQKDYNRALKTRLEQIRREAKAVSKLKERYSNSRFAHSQPKNKDYFYKTEYLSTQMSTGSSPSRRGNLFLRSDDTGDIMSRAQSGTLTHMDQLRLRPSFQ